MVVLIKVVGKVVNHGEGWLLGLNLVRASYGVTSSLGFWVRALGFWMSYRLKWRVTIVHMWCIGVLFDLACLSNSGPLLRLCVLGHRKESVTADLTSRSNFHSTNLIQRQVAFPTFSKSYNMLEACVRVFGIGYLLCTSVSVRYVCIMSKIEYLKAFCNDCQNLEETWLYQPNRVSLDPDSSCPNWLNGIFALCGFMHDHSLNTKSGSVCVSGEDAQFLTVQSWRGQVKFLDYPNHMPEEIATNNSRITLEKLALPGSYLVGVELNGALGIKSIIWHSTWRTGRRWEDLQERLSKFSDIGCGVIVAVVIVVVVILVVVVGEGSSIIKLLFVIIGSLHRIVLCLGTVATGKNDSVVQTADEAHRLPSFEIERLSHKLFVARFSCYRASPCPV
ncbi:hypothetical protein Tco_1493333 [Tanacetum coccineum]